MIYPRLFSPLQIRNLELSNRIIMAAMIMGYTPDGLVTDQLVAFYRERAKGRPGMIITGGAYIHPLGKGYQGMLSVESDDMLPGLKKVAAVIRKEGVIPAIQLVHCGRYSPSAVLGGQTPVSSSSCPSRLTRETPRELTTAEVEQVVESFGQAARRAREADFALVELLVGTGYLISQFLSPITNQRTDRYGGDLYGRMTFLREILAAVRSYAGGDFPVTCRISGDEFMPGGNTITEMTELVKVLEREKVDMVSVCAGWHESLVTPVTAEVPPGAYAYFTRTFKEHVAIPLAISNRINNPAVAEEILSLGHADAIVMARPFIADPLFAQKAKEGREEFIRPCVACNQGCLDHLFTGIPSVCMVNARTGHETEPSPEERPLKKRLLVVGAGPAGMEAARAAAVRGARVILVDAHPYLGGQLILAGTPPNRKPFLDLLRYYKNELQRLNVDIRLGETLTSESSLPAEADAVILATGGQPMIPPISGIASPQVMTAWEVLEGKKRACGNVVIVGGGATGCETAIYLAAKSEIPPAAASFLKRRDIVPPLPQDNLKITIVEMLKRVGSDIGVTTRWVVLQELALLGIQTMTQVEVTAIEPAGIVYRKEAGNLCRLPADSVVLATGVRSVNPLEEAWSAKTTLHVIGDARKPRKVLDAIEEGYRAAMALA